MRNEGNESALGNERKRIQSSPERRHSFAETRSERRIEIEDKWINAEGEIMRTEEEEEVPDIVAEELEVECQWMDLSMCSIFRQVC